MIFFDFDGVFYDSVKEAYAVAKIARDSSLKISDLDFTGEEYKRFRKFRYLIGPAWNYLYIFKNIDNNISDELFEEKYFEGINYSSMEEYGEFEKKYFEARSYLKKNYYLEWFNLNESFPFVKKMKNILNSGRAYIVTTKDKETVLKLLLEEGVKFPISRIFDREDYAKYGSKSNIIENILRVNSSKRGIFIDDSRKHLDSCVGIKNLECYQVDWGYVGPNEKALPESEVVKIIDEYISEKKEIVALIAVRGGSQRVPNKNLRNFAKTSLLELKINQLKKVKKIDEIIVNSDCDKMLDLALSLGVTAVKRDDYYASSTVNMSEVYKHFAENINSKYIMYTNVTNPLVETESYKKAIDLFYKNIKEKDSLTSCHDIKEFLWKEGEPLNYDPLNQPRSQDLPEIVALNFAISIIPRELMIKKRNIIGNKPYFYKLDNVESLDIDTKLDFYTAEKLYETLHVKKDDLLGDE